MRVIYWQDILSRLLYVHETPQPVSATGTIDNDVPDVDGVGDDQLEPSSIKLVAESSAGSTAETKAFFRVEILLDEETDEIIFQPPPDEYLVRVCDMFHGFGTRLALFMS